MDYNIINIIILLLGISLSLWETLLLAWGRRITKSSHTILGLANLGVLASLLNEIFDNIQSLIISLFLILILYTLISYYFGVEFRVHSQKPQLLENLIETAIREIECSKLERNKEDKKIRFTTDSVKEIELKEKDAAWGDKKVYNINFKRWLNYESRKEILTFIESTLQDEEEYKHSIIKICLQVLALVILTGVMVFLVSEMVMEPKDVRGTISNDLPEVVYILDTNKTYNDTRVIQELHKEFENSFGYKNNDITYERITEISEVSMHYESGYKILYIGRSNRYLYVDDAFIGNKTWFHRIVWKIHQLYDKTSGTYYRVFDSWKNADELLDKIKIDTGFILEK